MKEVKITTKGFPYNEEYTIPKKIKEILRDHGHDGPIVISNMDSFTTVRFGCKESVLSGPRNKEESFYDMNARERDEHEKEASIIIPFLRRKGEKSESRDLLSKKDLIDFINDVFRGEDTEKIISKLIRRANTELENTPVNYKNISFICQAIQMLNEK